MQFFKLKGKTLRFDRPVDYFVLLVRFEVAKMMSYHLCPCYLPFLVRGSTASTADCYLLEKIDLPIAGNDWIRGLTI